MATLWQMARGNMKIQYKNGKGIAAPCRCRRVFKVTLWDSMILGEVDDLTDFNDYFPVFVSQLSFGPGFRRFYSIHAIDEHQAHGYVPNIQCAPLFGDSGGAPIVVNATVHPLVSTPTNAQAWSPTFPPSKAIDNDLTTYAETNSVHVLGVNYDIGSLNVTNFSSLSQTGKALIRFRAHYKFETINNPDNVPGDGKADIKLERLNAFGAATVLTSATVGGSGAGAVTDVTPWYDTTDWTDLNNAQIEVKTHLGGFLGNLTRPVRVYELWMEVQYSTTAPATYHKDYEGGAALYSELTFPLLASSDWQFENILNVGGALFNKCMGYFLFEWTGETVDVPSFAALSGVLPAAYSPNLISWGEGYYDQDFTGGSNCSTTWVQTSPTYHLCAEVVNNGGTTSFAHFFPNVPDPLDGFLATYTAFIRNVNVAGHPAHKIVRSQYVAIKLTDFKFYSTLTLRVERSTPSNKSYVMVQYTPIASGADFAGAWTHKFTIAAASFPSPAYVDIDLTSLLDHSGRDIYVYLVPAMLVDGVSDLLLGTYSVVGGFQITPTFALVGTP